MPATATLNAQVGQSGNWLNVFKKVAVVAAEHSLEIDVQPGCPVQLTLVADTDWKYRTTTGDGTNDVPFVGSQALSFWFYQTTTIYFVRQSADGNLFYAVTDYKRSK